MKAITLDDCVELRERFDDYCKTAEVHEFPILSVVDTKFAKTLKKYEQEGYVTNQTDANAMFRVVLKVIGEDYSAYEE